jgi:hypothetical protein
MRPDGAGFARCGGVVQVIVVLCLDIRHPCEIEDRRQYKHYACHGHVGDVEGLAPGAIPCGVLGVEEDAADNRGRLKTD